MSPITFALSLLMLDATTAACATVPTASVEDRTLAFGCDDIVLVGRLENENYEHVEIEGDVLGHGWITAKIRVRKIVKGSRVPKVVPVRYFGHTYMREDRDFMFVLKRAEDETYEIRAAELMSERPRLANHCD